MQKIKEYAEPFLSKLENKITLKKCIKDYS